MAGEAQRYFIKDHLGSISLITDEIGSVEQAHYFDPWGMPQKVVTAGSIKQWQEDLARYRLSSKPITTRGFTGHEHLAEMDLIHMNGRLYDARLGRFVQADPIIQDPLRVQSLNRYSYVWNNPLNATDPSGFKCETVNDKQICTNDKPTEEVQVDGVKPPPQKNSGLAYTITDPTAIQQWLSQQGKSMADFESRMSELGISKASGSNRARAGSGVLWADKDGDIVGLGDKNNTAVFALGEVSAAAEEAIGLSPWVDSASPFAGRSVCGSDRACVAAADEFQTQGNIIALSSAIPIEGLAFSALKIATLLKRADYAKDALVVAKGLGNFADEAKLLSHFEKHGAEFGVKSADEYLSIARGVMQNGTKVQYVYKGETRTGFVQLMGNTNKGQSKFAFVGTNSQGQITTLHAKSGKDFWKTLNGNAQNKTIYQVQ